MTNVLRMDEKQYQELMEKRRGWQHGRLIVNRTAAAQDTMPDTKGGGPRVSDSAPGTVTTGNERPSGRFTPKAPAAAAPKKPVSEIEELLAGQISAVGNLPEPIREYPFLRGSRHRLDFAWPDWTYSGLQIGVEVQGMVHRVKQAFAKDLDKRAMGLLQGWVVLEVGGEQIRSGKAMEWLQELFSRAERRA